MYNLWYFRTDQTTLPMLTIVAIYVLFSLGVGSTGSGRKIGFFPAFIFSLILSPLVGWLITLAYPKIEKSEDPFLNQSIHNAMKAFHNGNMEDAFKRIKEAILRQPENGEAHLILGVFYAKEGNVSMAIKNVAKAKSLGIQSLELLDDEPFDKIKSSREWIEFKANDYETGKPIIEKPVSSTDELLKLGELLEKGLITREEFDAEKSKLLK